MPVPLYDLSIPLFTRSLHNLSAILTKAQSTATTLNKPDSTYLTARLHPTMLPLSSQLQICTDTAKFAAIRICADLGPLPFADAETTFAEFQERIAKTLELLEGVKAADLEGREDVELLLRPGTLGEMRVSAKDYLVRFAVPNFYFHLVTAYDILRAQGVEIGKADYLGDVRK